MKSKTKYFVLSMLLITLGIVTIIKLNDKKEVVLDNVSLKEEIKNNNNFALMIEEDGEYVESETFPTSGYVLNETLSGCVDNNGNTIENALTYTNGTINLRTRTNAMCYLYFDIKELTAAEYLIENVSSDVLWNSTLEDDGYRYVGTNPSNYVCFGYENATTDCDFTNATNTDLYAYRIIGIFEDSEGIPHIKLIKKEVLNSTYAWNADSNNDVDLDASDLFTGLNGDYFLGNTTYSYMQDTDWTDKIAEWDYTATNTKTYESSGTNYSSETVQNIYLHEMNRNSKPSSVGEWKYPTDDSWDKSEVPKVKISLMYVSDYLLSLGSSALEYTSYTNNTTLKTGWMHISNNDSDAYQNEWTSSRYGAYSNGYYYAWLVSLNGRVYGNTVVTTLSVRPVFYLKSDVELTGEGTTTNPYIIS